MASNKEVIQEIKLHLNKANTLQELKDIRKSILSILDATNEKTKQQIQLTQQLANINKRIKNITNENVDKDHEQANVLNRKYTIDKLREKLGEKHLSRQKVLSKTLHKNANTIERMEHNRKVLNNKLKKTVVGSKEHKTILEQINGLENRITNAKKQQNNVLKDAVKLAFSWEKIMNRMAFVITAKLSYELFNIVQRGLKEAITNTIEWQEELSKVFTLLEEGQERFREILSDEVAKAMMQYGQDLQTASRAAYDILSARFEPQEVGIILDDSLKLAVGEFTDLRVATDAVTTVLNSFQLEAYKAGEAASFISQMVTDGKTTLEELHTNLGKITSVAASLSFSMHDIGAAFSTVTLQGIKTDVAITSLRQLMMRLIDPSTEAQEVINKFGLDLDVASIQAGGFTKVLEEMVGLTEDELLAFAKSRRGAQALFALINSGTRFQEAYNRQLENSDEHLRKFEERSQNVRLAQENLKGTFTAVTAELNKNMLPIYADLLTSLSDFIVGTKIVVEVLYDYRAAVIALVSSIIILKKQELIILGIQKARLVLIGALTIAQIRYSIALGTSTGMLAKFKAAILAAGTAVKSLAIALGTVLPMALIIAGTAFILYGFGKIHRLHEEYNDLVEKTNSKWIQANAALDEHRDKIKDLSQSDIADKVVELQNAILAYQNLVELGIITDEQKRLLEVFKLQRDLYVSALDGLNKGESLRKRNIRLASEALDTAQKEFDLSEKNLQDMIDLKGVLEDKIEIQKENIKYDEQSKEIQKQKNAIHDDEVKLIKLQEDIKKEQLRLAKEQLDLATANYNLSDKTRADFDDLITAHRTYLGQLDDTLAKKQQQLVIDNLINAQTLKEINDRYKLAELEAKNTKDRIDDLRIQKNKAIDLAIAEKKSTAEIEELKTFYNNQIADLKLQNERGYRSELDKTRQLEIDLLQQKLDAMKSPDTYSEVEIKTIQTDVTNKETTHEGLLDQLEITKTLREEEEYRLELAKKKLELAKEKLEEDNNNKDLNEDDIKILQSSINLLEGSLQKYKDKESLLQDNIEKSQQELQIAKDNLEIAKNIGKLNEEEIRRLQEHIDKKQAKLDHDIEIKAIEEAIYDAQQEGDTKRVKELEKQKKLLEEIFEILNGKKDYKFKFEDINWYNILGVPEFKSAADAITYMENQLANTIQSGIDNALQAQLDSIEERKEKDLEALEDQANAYREHAAGIVLTDAHRSRVLESIKRDEEKKKAEIEEKAAEDLAEQKKKNAIAEATIDYAKGLIGIWAKTIATTLDPGLAAALSAILTGVYLAQRGIIENTKFAEGGFTGSSTQPSDNTGERPAGVVHEKEFVMNKKATKGNVGLLYSMQDKLSKGRTFEQFASDYIIGKISPVVNAIPQISYAQGGYAVGNTSGGTYIDMSGMESRLDSQQVLFSKMEKRLSSIERSNKDVSDNTYKLRKKGRGI